MPVTGTTAIPQKTSIAALAFEIGADGGVKTEAHLLPPGPFRAEDGRPFDCDSWMLDAAIADRVIARMAARKNDTLIDYEHQSMRAEYNGQKVPAAGWFNAMLWRDGKGLFATGIAWTVEAGRMIAAREYRYISALFTYYPSTGEVLEIISVALTNTPALDGLESLAALARKFSVFNQPPTQGENMGIQEQLAALSTERDGLNTKVAALTAERDQLSTKVAQLTADRDGLQAKIDAAEKEKAEAQAAADKAKHADLVQAALTDGRLAPAQKGWAEKLSLAALSEYLDASAPILPGGRQAEGRSPDGGAGLTGDELAMCTKLGVTPEEFKKAKG